MTDSLPLQKNPITQDVEDVEALRLLGEEINFDISLASREEIISVIETLALENKKLSALHKFNQLEFELGNAKSRIHSLVLALLNAEKQLSEAEEVVLFLFCWVIPQVTRVLSQQMPAENFSEHVVFSEPIKTEPPKQNQHSAPEFSRGNLFHACEYGDFHVAQQLISYGADVNEVVFMPKYSASLPSLYVATCKGNEKIVKLLLDTGRVNVNAIISIDNSTALHYACTHNNLAIVKLLIEIGKADVNKASDYIGTPLHCACAHGNVEIACFLLDHKADITALHPDGSSALWISCSRGKNVGLVSLLIEKGKGNVNVANSSGWTPLHAATCYGSIDMVKTLIEVGYANFKECDLNGWTPLHLACNGGFVDIVRYLVNIGSNLNQPTSTGTTPLTLACRYGNLEICSILLDAGADINSCTSAENNSFIIDCKCEFMDYLLKSKDVSVPLPDFSVYPLFIACWTCNVPLITLLIEKYHAHIPLKILRQLAVKEAARNHYPNIENLLKNYIQAPFISFLCGHHARCGINSTLNDISHDILLVIAQQAYSYTQITSYISY